ncbi:MAG TPA: hypothetical protein VLJ38_13540, partial [Polyangiaceae bacterium]|nr:hypothetical protein [Polyangiaceae bacterium]
SAARSTASAPQKEPLLYAFVIVEGDVYGAPISPDVNARAVREHIDVAKLQEGVPTKAELEITGRSFGLAAELAPDLGAKVAIAVLRSET